jgi:hypothetical protein
VKVTVNWLILRNYIEEAIDIPAMESTWVDYGS